MGKVRSRNRFASATSVVASPSEISSFRPSGQENCKAIVGPDAWIAGHECQTLYSRLSYDEAIKWIPVMEGKARNLVHVSRSDSKVEESLIGNGRGHCAIEIQTAEGAFDDNLPGDGRADQDLVGVIE